MRKKLRKRKPDFDEKCLRFLRRPEGCYCFGQKGRMEETKKPYCLKVVVVVVEASLHFIGKVKRGRVEIRVH